MCLAKIFATFLMVGIAANAESAPADRLNLCNREDLIESNVTSYRYKITPSQNCDCNRVSCVRKCCADGFYLTKGFCIQYANSSYDFRIPLYRNQVFSRYIGRDGGFVVGTMSCKFYPFIPLLQPDKDRFLVQEDGSIWTYLYGVVDSESYCVDDLDDLGLSAFICEQDENIAEVIFGRFNVVGMIISMPFLLLTFIAYALLPDRNLHMKALMSYVMTLLLGYILLVVVQLNSVQLDIGPCKTLGYSIIFTLMASFLWMNVICIDIWFAFSGLRGFSGTKRAENKRFIFYNIYAWGVTILITIIVILMNEINQPSKAWYVPGISSGQCFLSNGYPELVYFYGPMGVIITINIILFAMTAFRIRQVKKETSMLKKSDSQRHSSYEDDKQKFNLYLKLLFAMGVNWSMEIISWAVSWKVQDAPKSIWHLTDFCNAIYGVFIFFIFVFKRSIYKLLMKRYYSFRGQSHLAHSMTANPTRATSYSTASTTIRDSNQGGNAHDSSLLTTTET